MAYQLNIYTLWASMKGEDPSPWMIAAEDEFSWEGNPDRCEKVFQDARNLADRNDWDYREVVVNIDIDDVAKCFMSGKTQGTVTGT